MECISLQIVERECVLATHHCKQWPARTPASGSAGIMVLRVLQGSAGKQGRDLGYCIFCFLLAATHGTPFQRNRRGCFNKPRNRVYLANASYVHNSATYSIATA
jgi:hypothetical protein